MSRRSQRRVVAAFVLPYVLLGLVWVFANPAMAAPDENDHLVKALGLARLDIGRPAPPAPPDAAPGDVRNASIARVVEIPSRLDPTGYACFRFDAAATAACQPAQPATTAGGRDVATTLGAYPPFLYPPLGWAASLGSDPVQAVRLGRLAVLAASAVLLWLTTSHLVRWLGPRSLLGVVVVLTPTAVFTVGVLGTSAVEILGALGLSAVAVSSARRPESLAETSTQVLVLVFGTVLVLSRQLGVVAMALITTVLLALGGRQVVWAALRRGRPVTWAAVLAPGIATVAVLAWEARYDHPVLLGPWASPGSLGRFVAQLPQLVQEGVGRFGWLDVRPPGWLNLLWFAAAAVLVVAGLVLGDRRDRAVTAAVLVVALLVGYLVYARVFDPIGAGLQGRHVLPVLALAPVWSGVVVAERARPALLRRVVSVGAVALPAVLLVGLVLNAKRYAVGLGPSSGPWWFVSDAQWSPPLGWWPWLVLSLAACGAVGVAWRRVTQTDATAGPLG